MTSPYRSWAEISRAQLASNYDSIQQAAGPGVTVMPVVKADAYRHGAVEVSHVLIDRGAKWLAVGNVEEGVALRQAGITARILVMADFLPACRRALAECDLTPVIHDLDELAALDEIGRKLGKSISFHLKIDSGMRRLGTVASALQIAETLSLYSFIHLEGMMTHFASVSDFTTSRTEDQAAYFFQIVDELKGRGIDIAYQHLSSTGGLAHRRQEHWGNLVRPGHAVYGYVAPPRGEAPPSRLQVRPVLSWKAAILAVKEIPQGSEVGYGGIFVAPETMRIAVVAVGYADGLPHRLSNRGRMIVGGKYAPILGAVSMDLTTIDVTQCPDVQVGQPVTIIGSEGDARIDAQQIARQAGTISYAVLCGISSRVKRVYL